MGGTYTMVSRFYREKYTKVWFCESVAEIAAEKEQREMLQATGAARLDDGQ